MTINKQPVIRNTEVVNGFCLLELTSNNKGIRHHKISQKLTFRRVVTKALEKIYRNYEIFMPKKIRILQAIIFL